MTTTLTNYTDQGREAFHQGNVRIVPRDILINVGKEAARAWYRGWDAANLGAEV